MVSSVKICDYGTINFGATKLTNAKSKAGNNMFFFIMLLFGFCGFTRDYSFASYLLLNSEQTTAVATATFNDSDVVLLVEKLGI